MTDTTAFERIVAEVMTVDQLLEESAEDAVAWYQALTRRRKLESRLQALAGGASRGFLS